MAGGVTLNQFLTSPLTKAYFRKRAMQADIPGALKVLDRLGIGNAPLPGDRMPELQKKRRARKQQANK